MTPEVVPPDHNMYRDTAFDGYQGLFAVSIAKTAIGTE